MPDGIDVKSLLAANLKRARLNRGWSQLKLATEAGLAHNFINNIEQGKKWVSPDSIDRLCAVLLIEPYQLFAPETIAPADKNLAVGQLCDEITLRATQLIDEVRAKYLG